MFLGQGHNTVKPVRLYPQPLGLATEQLLSLNLIMGEEHKGITT